MAACCTTQALNCTLDLGHGILSPAMVKDTFAIGVGHGIFSGNANGFQDPFFFTLDICDFICVYRRIVTSISSHTFSYSPDNLIQFPNLSFILMSINTLIHNHLFFINPQKHLS